jgi:acyl-coenzyme A thioesterase PaaI-like protein
LARPIAVAEDGMTESVVEDPAETLAAELRAITAELALREVSREEAVAALARARALRAGLQGPPRSRWYDHDPASPTTSVGARDAYGDSSPVRGCLNPVAPPLVIERVEEGPKGPHIRGDVTFSRAYEGPPHGVHGGFVAAMFDEILGAVMGLAPPPGVTATLEVRYRHVTPLEEPLHLEAWIESDRGRRLTARATCHAASVLTAEAHGLFVRVDFSEVQQRMAERRRG